VGDAGRAEAASDFAVAAEALTVAFDRFTAAVSHVNLALKRPGIVGLVGANGAGKTTLLRTIAGFERPTSGRVWVNGREPHSDPATISRDVAFVSQASPLFGGLTAIDHVQVAASMRPGYDGADAMARLKRHSVPLRRGASKLSSGERMQVALALALAKRAPIVLLDEPFAPLDPLARRAVIRDLKTYSKAVGALVLISSHDIYDLAQAVTRILVMVSGRIVLDDDVARSADGRVVAAVDAVPSDAGVVATGDRQPLGAPQELSLEEVVLAYLSGDVGGEEASYDL